MSRQRGIAMVLVLWILTLLTVIAGGFAYTTRTEASLTANLVELARARAIADAGLYRTVLELVRPVKDPARRWKTDGRLYALEFGGGRIEVSVRDEAALIDLNRASEVLLKGLFLSVGVDDEHASRIVDAILDWRDPDDLTHVNGAEREQYQREGLDYEPANADFSSVEELAMVLGMTPEIYHRVAGALTVYSRQPGINSTMASRAVLLAVPGAAPEEVDAYIQSREALRAENQPIPPFAPAQAFAAEESGLVYNVRAHAILPDRVAFLREAVVQLTQEPKHPFLFLNWKEGQP
jgi:general secretion pathway protein K